MKDIKDWTWEELLTHCGWYVVEGLMRGERLQSSMVSVYNIILAWQKAKGIVQ